MTNTPNKKKKEKRGEKNYMIISTLYNNDDRGVVYLEAEDKGIPWLISYSW